MNAGSELPQTNTPFKRGLWLAGNWKMNLGPQEARLFFEKLKSLIASSHSSTSPLHPEVKPQCLLFPPAVSLETAQRLTPSSIQIGAQNAAAEKQGAFTGEISGPMLQQLGLSWVLLGHSERRFIFGETEEQLFKKAKSLLEQGFHILYCIGETLSEREKGETLPRIQQQLKALFSWEEVATYASQITLAYEPVWAIGTGLSATPTQANKVHQSIREELTQQTSSTFAEHIPILYGGSVQPQNLKALLEQPQIDGALVGGASLSPDRFFEMMEITQLITC